MKKNMNIWEDAWALGQSKPIGKSEIPAPPLAKAVPEQRPKSIQRREDKAAARPWPNKRASNRTPDPSKVLEETQVCLIKDFNSWSEASVPIHVVLCQESYADDHQQQWGLMTTQEVSDPFRSQRELRPARGHRGTPSLIEVFLRSELSSPRAASTPSWLRWYLFC